MFPSYLKINSVSICIQCSTGSNKICSNIHFKTVWHMGFKLCDIYDFKCFFLCFLGQQEQIIRWKRAGPRGINALHSHKVKSSSEGHWQWHWWDPGGIIFRCHSWAVKVELLCYSTFCVEDTKYQWCICEDATESLKWRYIFSILSGAKDSLSNFIFHGQTNDMPGNNTKLTYLSRSNILVWELNTK